MVHLYWSERKRESDIACRWVHRESKLMFTLRVRSHLATATQIFDVVSMSPEMGCIVTNVTVRT